MIVDFSQLVDQKSTFIKITFFVFSLVMDNVNVV